MRGQVAGEHAGIQAAIASLCLIYYMSAFLGSRVVSARGKHGVPLPFMYPPHNNVLAGKVKDPAGFMAVVRGHENMLEALPLHTVAHLVLQTSPEGSLLHRPFTAALGSFLFAIGRAWYAVGYSSEEMGPNGRLGGLFVAMLGTSLLWGELMRALFT